ncbi:MAG: DUF805 domain-containing protein [Trueperaceae bacterium]|nr:DUF805 domain-containing protein [Trueperaceae bacterium]
MSPKTFYPFALRGRLGRRRYAAYLLAWTVLIGLIGAALDLAVLGGTEPLPPPVARPSFVPALLAHPLVHVALAVRRFHDMGANGALGLLVLSFPLSTFAFPFAWVFAVASLAVLGVTLAWPGDRGANAYGTRASLQPDEEPTHTP